MYRAVVKFADLSDNKYLYHAGDEFPRKGLKADQKRLDELAGNDNKAGFPLIEYVKEEEPKTEETPKKKRAKK